MNPYHQEIRGLLDGAVDPAKLRFNVAKYLGSPSAYLNIPTLKKRKLIKDWARQNKGIPYPDFLGLLNSLIKGKSFQEKSSAAELLVCFPKYRRELDPRILDEWLDHLSGWAEIDTLCQSTFEPEEILAKWPVWEKLLRRFSANNSISKRRASLVLLTKAVRKSSDVRLKKQAFDNIERLERERDILITKAVSWLLRSLVKHHRAELSTYLKKHKELLPPIAYRETTAKLETGRKYNKK